MAAPKHKRGEMAASLVGKRFGRFLVIGVASENNRICARCRCDCGNERLVPCFQLTNGVRKSCGCIHLHDQSGKGRRVSGSRETFRLYRVWQSMISRCDVVSDRSFPQYGGRGISVCERWRESFWNFIDDMGPRPAGHSVERINNHGNYEPSNCRWATPTEQGNNKRNNRIVLAFGERKTLADWSRDVRCAVSKDALMVRLLRGWTPESALQTRRLRQPKAAIL